LGSSTATFGTRQMSRSATAKIFQNLLKSFRDGSDIEARANMLAAAYEAGIAISWGHVGYVHAIAHQLGGIYGTPHGVANAMVLPHVVEFYIKHKACDERLAACAIAAGLGSHYEEYEAKDHAELAQKFWKAILDMNKELEIPTAVPQMKPQDVKVISDRAAAECHGLQFATDIGYPVPCRFSLEEINEIVGRLLPPAQAKL